jgi:hypothetical protein
MMKQTFRIDVGSYLKVALLCAALSATPLALAENAPACYVASPDVYKLVHEDDNFLVIEATWLPGQKDNMHSHFPTAIYWITDCQLTAEIPGGKRIEGTQKAGTSRIQPAVAAHFATNMGTTTCKALLVERKPGAAATAPAADSAHHE